MSIPYLLQRYSLDVMAKGGSEETIQHTTMVMKFFTDFMGGVDDVTKLVDDDLKRFIVYLRQKRKWSGLPHVKDEKLGATAINTYVRALKGFFNWLERESIIEVNPFSKVPTPKPPKVLPKIFTEQEMKAVFQAVASKPREMALILLFLDSGITLSEIKDLPDTQVDTLNGTLRVFREKTRKERVVYFSPQTAAAIETYRFSRPDPMAEPHLFLTHEGYPLKGTRIQKILERVGKQAGLSQRLSPHKLRHTFATMSLKYGSNLEYIRIMLGHSDIRTTQNAYLNVASEDIAKSSKKTSPVANLGLRKSNGYPLRPTLNGNITNDRNERIIVVNVQNEKPGGIMPVSYDAKNKQKKGRNNK
ncbi:tyrosine-type recombinase/integrase [Chloroflexota bacterium]